MLTSSNKSPSFIGGWIWFGIGSAKGGQSAHSLPPILAPPLRLCNVIIIYVFHVWAIREILLFQQLLSPHDTSLTHI